MATDLAHVGMPEPDGMVRLLFSETAVLIPLAVLAVVHTCRRVDTILGVLRNHVDIFRLDCPLAAAGRRCLSSRQACLPEVPPVEMSRD